MSYCKDCISGVRHEGTPEGKVEKIGGVDCYVSVPTVDYPKDAVILLLTDVFGMTWINNQLLADDFAKNGFKVVVIDLFHGDPFPPATLSGSVPGFDRGEWFKKHSLDHVGPVVQSAYAALVEQGITRFALTGYCFGARVVFDLAFEGKAKAATITHPSMLTVPNDFDKYKSISKAPLLINSCEVDSQFPIESQAKADEIMAGFAPGYKRTYWEGCNHGFATRGDISDPKVKAGKEGSFEATVLWFLEHL